MPSLLSKLKALVNSESPSKSTENRAAPERKAPNRPLEKQAIVNGQSRSRPPSSLAPTSEAKKSDHILDVLKSTFNFKHLRTVADVALQQIDGEPVDDTTYLMERIVQLVSDLPISSRTSSTLTNAFLNQLWTDLQHPPQSYLGADYIFRKADGSYNNILWPHLGGEYYLYSVDLHLLSSIQPHTNLGN